MDVAKPTRTRPFKWECKDCGARGWTSYFPSAESAGAKHTARTGHAAIGIYEVPA